MHILRNDPNNPNLCLGPTPHHSSFSPSSMFLTPQLSAVCVLFGLTLSFSLCLLFCLSLCGLSFLLRFSLSSSLPLSSPPPLPSSLSPPFPHFSGCLGSPRSQGAGKARWGAYVGQSEAERRELFHRKDSESQGMQCCSSSVLPSAGGRCSGGTGARTGERLSPADVHRHHWGSAQATSARKTSRNK